MASGVAESPVVLGYTAIHLLTLGVTLSVAVYTARNYWDKLIGRVFGALLATVILWTAGSLARLFTPTLDLFVAVTAFKYVGIAGAPVLFLLFALLYDGKSQWVTRPMIGAVSALPALTVPVVATTQFHGLFYSGYAMTPVDTVSVLSIVAVGPWYWLFTVYSWTLVAVASGLLVHAGIQRTRFYRLQLLILLPAIGISWTTNILYVVWSWPHPALDPTPIGFAGTVLLLGFGLFSTQLVEVSPAARSLVFDVIDDAVLVVDQADRVVDVNSAAKPLLSVAEPFGSELTTVLADDIAEQIQTDADTIEVGEEPTQRHYRYRELTQPDTIEGRVLVFTDITDYRESQQAAEQAHEQLRQIIDLIPDPLFVKNREDEVLLSNEANADLLGSTPDAIEGQPEPEVMPDVPNYEQYRQRDIEVIEKNISTVFEEELTGPDGERYIFQTTRLPFETASTEEDAVLGYARDVTALKEYEQQLEALNTRLQLALEETDTGVWEWNLDTDEVVWDETSERLYGYDPGEFPGTFDAFTARVHDEDLPVVRDEIDSAIDSGEEYRADFRVEHPDGNQRWLQTRGVVQYDDGDPIRMIGIQTDITERKESEQRLEQARAELRQVIDLIPDPIFVKNRDDQVLLSNEANAELHGMTPDEIEGEREGELISDVENIESIEMYRQRELEVMDTGETRVFEEELTGPDGNTYTFKTTRIPFTATGRDEDAVLGYARDVTDLKEYEQQLEEARRTLERTNEELETLNRILRHDIRNDVVVMSRLGTELEDHVDDDGTELLTQLLERGEHIRTLTTGLRDLMRTLLEEERELRPVRIDTVIKSEVRDASRSADDAIVTMEDIPRVHVQADQMLSSVFRNILENAIRHNDSDVPEVTVSAQNRDDTVEIRISDNGPGVPEDIRDDIFGKGERGLESKGTGIGLYLVTQLLDEYGGEVWVEDRERQSPSGNRTKSGARAEHDSAGNRPAADDNDPRGAVFVVELPKLPPETNQPTEQ